MRQQTIDPFFRRLLITALLVLSLWLIYKLIPVLMPFIVAFILAYLLNPIVAFLSHYMKRWIGILLVYGVISLGLGVLLWWFIPTLWQQLQAAWDYVPRIVEWYNQDVRTWFNQHSRFGLPPLQSQEISNTLVEYLNKNYNAEDAQSLFKNLMNSGLTVINNAGLIILVPILTFYYLFNWDKRIKSWKLALPSQGRQKVIQIAKDCDAALMAFVKGQLLVMILLGVIYAVQLQLIGLELGLIIGLVAGIASFVPYLGTGIGIIGAIIAGLFQFGLDWVHLGLIVGAFMVGQAIEGYVLQPLLLGDKIGLSPLWVIFSVLAGASLLGFVGMLIALPVSAVINVLFQHAYNAYKETEFYRGKKQYKLFK